ncbi:MAG: phosphatidate cytidylyltransferase [Thermoanaerobaculia bacterium]
MKRVLTAAVGAPLALAAIFWLPGKWFFLVVLALFLGGVIELVRLCRHHAPGRPLWSLLILVPAAAAAMGPWPLRLPEGFPAQAGLLVVAAVVSVGLGALVLATRTPTDQAVAALGVLAYAVPYFSVPVASLYLLQQIDPWLLFALLAVVWLGDTAALYFGTMWGRHKMAPVVSPNKSWEGAVAGLAVAILVTAAWSWWRLDRLSWPLIALGGVTAVAAQTGDLVESLIKRSAGVKDSGNLFPGHGGVLDRMDALTFAAPVWLLGLWLVGKEAWLP